MSMPQNILAQLEKRENNHSFRQLGFPNNGVDFSSNDYLGFAKSESIFLRAHQLVLENKGLLNGSTGSRLLSGNHGLYSILEKKLTQFHEAETALVFNSGYDANLGILSAVPQRGNVLFYDEYIHASLRDGIGLSKAKAYKFKHNDLIDLKKKIKNNAPQNGDVFIVTESVFSMDGDSPDLIELVNISKKENAHLIIDEAHATGVFGNKGEGLIQKLNLTENIFARIHTFGKSMGCHGAAILGSKKLKEYLVNFSRSFIYTTGLPPHSVATAIASYEELERTGNVQRLRKNISFFKNKINEFGLSKYFLESNSAIQICIISGNGRVKNISQKIKGKGFDVKAILHPTVPEGMVRLRFCLHAFNTEEEMLELLTLLKLEF